MRAEFTIAVESATLKRLLAGVSDLENALPYGGDGYEVQVTKLDIGVVGGIFEVWSASVDSDYKIASIKAVRGVTSWGLKEAKEAVDLCINGGKPILLGSFRSKIEAVKCMEYADSLGSISGLTIKARSDEV